MELAGDEGGGDERSGRVEVEVEGHLLVDGLHRGGGRGRERAGRVGGGGPGRENGGRAGGGAAQRSVEDNQGGSRA